ncbi:MAG: zinc metallopeptidase [Candidatus Latescibacteria bacterium]|nr:zinc metallopeptidase [Candidatus Latescibacterota bacterium]
MVLILPALALALWAQYRVKHTFAKYSEVPSRRGMTGAQVANAIMERNHLNVAVEPIEGSLTDHYDPRDRTLRLSEDVYGSRSLSALGVAAHEAGHALQHAQHYLPLQIRGNLVPVANFGSTLAMPLFLVGLFLPAASFLMDIGILLFTFAVVFSLVTLPVEYNASSRALQILSQHGYLAPDEIDTARKVLNAAAWTYVAAAAMAILQLVRLLILRGQRED